MAEFIDLTGKKFGRWTAISYQGKGKWLCKCDCGTVKTVHGDHIRGGYSTSCGCLQREKSKKRAYKHGKSNTRIYYCWSSMKERCTNPKKEHYECYGGRGIKFYEPWKDFSVFYDWAIENGYRDDLTLDRIETDGDYCPENCRWTTMREQANNTRRSRWLEYNGEKHTVSEWERIKGVKPGFIHKRLKNGWSIEEAIEKEIGYKHKKGWREEAKH